MDPQIPAGRVHLRGLGQSCSVVGGVRHPGGMIKGDPD